MSRFIIMEFIIPRRTVEKEFLSFTGNPFARTVYIDTQMLYACALMIQTYIQTLCIVYGNITFFFSKLTCDKHAKN